MMFTKKLTLITISIFLMSLSLSCAGAQYSGGIYTYDPVSPNPYYDPYGNSDYSRDILGEWEGFIYETYRSDNLNYGKKTLALRCSYVQPSWTGYYFREWVKVDVLIDGRPSASKKVEIKSNGYLSLSSYENGIDLYLSGYFRNNSGNGDVLIDWEEKVVIPPSDKTFLHRVEVEGDFAVWRVNHTYWGASWDLFDTYKDEVFSVADEVWEVASRTGMAHLEEI